MPELPDAAGYRRLLARSLHRLTSVDVIDPGVLRNTDAGQLHDAVAGHDVRAVERHGKWLVVAVDRAAVLIHLGMTGSLAMTAEQEPIHRDDRAVLHGDADIRLRDRRRLGGIWLVADRAHVADITGPLGPDATSITITQLHAALAPQRTGLKTVLMDQTAVAGLGNTLSDEILWVAGLHPQQRSDSLTPEQLTRLHTAMRDVVRRAARAGAIPRTPSWLTGQRQSPAPICPRCRHPLERTPVAARTALWCPSCQSERH